MKDFGFWVRVIAISQLFGIVLANYGDHWLSPANPVLTYRSPPPPPKPLHEIVMESVPKGVSPVAVPTVFPSERQKGVEGWGGAAPRDAESWSEAEAPDAEPEEIDDSLWGAAPDE